jgi:hypothetical protein
VAVQWDRDGKTKFLDFEGGSTVEGCWRAIECGGVDYKKQTRGVSGTQPMAKMSPESDVVLIWG